MRVGPGRPPPSRRQVSEDARTQRHVWEIHFSPGAEKGRGWEVGKGGLPNVPPPFLQTEREIPSGVKTDRVPETLNRASRREDWPAEGQAYPYMGPQDHGSRAPPDGDLLHWHRLQDRRAPMECPYRPFTVEPHPGLPRKDGGVVPKVAKDP